MASPKASWESIWQRNLTKSPSAKCCTVYPMRRFLALLFAVLALSVASPAIDRRAKGRDRRASSLRIPNHEIECIVRPIRVKAMSVILRTAEEWVYGRPRRHARPDGARASRQPVDLIPQRRRGPRGWPPGQAVSTNNKGQPFMTRLRG
jgi:hypothetical protein